MSTSLVTGNPLQNDAPLVQIVQKKPALEKTNSLDQSTKKTVEATTLALGNLQIEQKTIGETNLLEKQITSHPCFYDREYGVCDRFYYSNNHYNRERPSWSPRELLGAFPKGTYLLYHFDKNNTEYGACVRLDGPLWNTKRNHRMPVAYITHCYSFKVFNSKIETTLGANLYGNETAADGKSFSTLEEFTKICGGKHIYPISIIPYFHTKNSPSVLTALKIGESLLRESLTTPLAISYVNEENEVVHERIKLKLSEKNTFQFCIGKDANEVSYDSYDDLIKSDLFQSKTWIRPAM